MKRILVFDGATGSELQKHHLEGCPELLNVTAPDPLIRMHKCYLEAGAEVLTTNTFGLNRHKLQRYGLEDRMEELGLAAVKNARAAGNGNFKVAFDAGPTGLLLKPYGDADFDFIYELYKEVAVLAQKAKADYILLETFSQLGELRAAFLAMKEHTTIPILCLMTFEENGKSVTGVDPACFAVTMEAMGAEAVGVNCSVGPDKLQVIVRSIRDAVRIPVIAMPNAGIPTYRHGVTSYDMDASSFAMHMEALVEAGADIIGGCCGTSPQYIKELNSKLDRYQTIKNKRRDKSPSAGVLCSSRKMLTVGDRAYIVGERINPTGRKVMGESLRNGDLGVILKEAIEQIEAGAEILDVNVAVPGLDEVQTMSRVINELQSIVEVPLQIDSTEPMAIERALRLYNGIAIVNSVNAREESLTKLLPLVRKYGCCVIALAMEENIATTSEGRWKAALKIIDRAETMGINRERIFVDSLTLTAGTAQPYLMETLKTLKQARDYGVGTALGISNVSYGLPERTILNATFFAMALGYGLNLAIINPKDIKMMEVMASARVIMNWDKKCQDYIRWADSRSKATETNAQQSQAKKQEWSLKESILNGIRDLAMKSFNEALKHREAIELVNEDIIPAIRAAGDLYEKGALYLPQLLQCADIVSELLEEAKKTIPISQQKDRIILATIRGDIHDIGKNIVKTLLKNNGYEVIDLGCDVSPEQIKQAVLTQNVKLVGLSALMTTTLPSLKETIELLKGTDCKVMVGGAVLNEQLSKELGAHFFGKDAIEAVKLADLIFNEVP